MVWRLTVLACRVEVGVEVGVEVRVKIGVGKMAVLLE